MVPLAVFSPVLIGISLVAILMPKNSLKKGQLLTGICIGIGLGLGMTSALAFVWLASDGQLAFTYYTAEIGLAVGLAVLTGYRVHSSNEMPAVPAIGSAGNLGNLAWLKYVFLILLFFCVASYLLKTFGNAPHGKWDAWAIWNFRARWLFRGGDQWTYAFSRYVADSHPDYPLLLPMSVFRFWNAIGNDPVTVPILLAGFFTFGSILLVFSAVSMFRGRNQGYLAAILMLLTTKFIKEGTHQYSDVPLAFYILSTMVLFSIRQRYPAGALRIMFLAGLTTSCTFWAKNEGLIFGVLIIMVHFAGTMMISDWRQTLKEFFSFLGGMAPVFFTLVLFKMYYAPPNDLVNMSSLPHLWNNLLNYDRHYMVLAAFADEILLFNDGVFILMVVYMAAIGIDKMRLKDRQFLAQAVLPILMLGSYFFTYVLFSHKDLDSLAWHLSSSLDRLVIHIWPTFVFLFFSVVKGPEKQGVAFSHFKF